MFGRKKKKKLYYVRVTKNDGSVLIYENVEDFDKLADRLRLTIQGQKKPTIIDDMREFSVRESYTEGEQSPADIHYTTDLSWGKQEIVRTDWMFCDERCNDSVPHDRHIQLGGIEYRYCKKCHTHTTWINGVKDPTATRYEDRTKGTSDFKRADKRKYRSKKWREEHPDEEE